MPTSLSMPPRRDVTTWAIAGRAEALARLEPLISAHRGRRPVRVLGPQFASSDLNGAAAVLVVGDVHISPRRALPGVFLRAGNGDRVPAGWLPDVGKRLEVYALSAAEVQRRGAKDSNRGPFVFLNERDDRAMAAVDQVVAKMPSGERVFRWTSERISRPDLIDALQGGQGAAFYFGRGNARGLAGYGGFYKSDARSVRGHALGSLLCLTCSVSSRPRHGLSFCEEAVLSGVCAGALGATGLTLHQDNLRLGLALARALRFKTITTLSELLLSQYISATTLRYYRIVGDPMAQLVGHPASLERAKHVFAPASGSDLPVIPFATWGGEEGHF